jgi:hypothetical protein
VTGTGGASGSWAAHQTRGASNRFVTAVFWTGVVLTVFDVCATAWFLQHGYATEGNSILVWVRDHSDLAVMLTASASYRIALLSVLPVLSRRVSTPAEQQRVRRYVLGLGVAFVCLFLYELYGLLLLR